MKSNNSTKFEKKLGVWMDHSVAYLMEYSPSTIITSVIDSEFTHDDKQKTLSKSENLMHNKEQQSQLKFYNKLAEVIANYENIVLFGPTTAKDELFNLLKENFRFSDKRIEVENAQQMTESQKHSFVNSYFNEN
jgi:stalled ribosome rescue protein Dom34